ncbi:MAG: hypothetical protein OXG42_03675, partial [Chloroflexi bacterium]|nr:hypothetical protein [Chloroflexota bacterium]
MFYLRRRSNGRLNVAILGGDRRYLVLDAIDVDVDRVELEAGEHHDRPRQRVIGERVEVVVDDGD